MGRGDVPRRRVLARHGPGRQHRPVGDAGRGDGGYRWLPGDHRGQNYAINNHLGDVISQSFGATEQTFSSPAALLGLRSAYFNAQANNVTVLASSGDDGVTNARFNGTLFTHRVVGWPSSDPLVTSVGGLQLHLNAQGDETQSDNVWNESYLFGDATAGGGGPSAVFTRPTYQDGVKGIVGLHRGTPDISLSAVVNGAASGVHVVRGIARPGFLSHRGHQ